MSEPQLDHTTLLVLGALLDGFEQDVDMHGWRIMQHVGRSGPRVYRALDKLEEWGWVDTWWESLRRAGYSTGSPLPTNASCWYAASCAGASR